MNKYLEPERSCKNCRYYSRHYSKQGIRFSVVDCGHCCHKDVRNYKKRPLELCGYWEDIAIIKEERKLDIKEAVVYMSERLNELIMILKDDMES